MNTDFQTKLENIEFKTIKQNRVATLGFADLFANRRVVVFSITNVVTASTLDFFKEYDGAYNELLQLGIDDVYAVSTDPMIAPSAERFSKTIIGLADRNTEFVKYVADYFKVDKDLVDLSRRWQYAVIINNGVPEKLIQTPLKKDMTWKIFKNSAYRYYGSRVEKVKKYLLDNLN